MDVIDAYKKEFISYLNSKVKNREPKNLYEPISYILKLGGKRLRPVLTLMSCELFGGKSSEAYDAALAIEMFHNFTLIHDDIMDNASLRRGNSTVHTKWDLNTGILSGDALMIMAYQSCENYPPHLFKKLLLLFSKTALEVCEGQQLDIDFEDREDVSLDEYLKMITYKTSVLVAAALQMGALIANASENDISCIYDFGLNIGIAFQLQDDYLDTFGNAETFGKKIGGDILENKKTFLYLKTLEVANANDKNELISLYHLKDLNEQKIEAVTKLFTKNNIPAITKNEIAHYTEKAFDSLKKLSVSKEKKELLKTFGLDLMKRTI
ncbi:polyprenyl synthetase family protein [Lutibacter sp.]